MTDSKKASRRADREQAFQILYGLNYMEATGEPQLRFAFAQWPNPAIPVDKREEIAIIEACRGFAWELVHGVWKNLAELDEVIARHSRHWRVERIARIELTILRLGLYEMLHRPDIPPKVAINEAVELAKQYGDGNSRGFVNGILDAAAREADGSSGDN